MGDCGSTGLISKLETSEQRDGKYQEILHVGMQVKWEEITLRKHGKENDSILLKTISQVGQTLYLQTPVAF